MKLLQLLPLLLLLVFVSCKKDDPSGPSADTSQYVQPHEDPASRGQIVSITKIGTYSKDLLQFGIDSELGNEELGLPEDAEIELLHDVDYYKIIYNTLDWNNEPLTASGALAVPVGTDSVRLTSYMHGTVTKNQDAPSQQNGDPLELNGEAPLGIIMASLGYGVSMPDYLGIGEWDPQRVPIHPYQHRKTEAISSIDMLRASRQQLQTLGKTERPGGAVLLGYSQGGHTTAATLWDIQEFYRDEIEVLAAIPMSGPYSMSGVMRDLMIEAQPYSQPMFIAYLLHAYNMVYAVYDSPLDYFKPEYADTSYQLLLERAPVSVINTVMPAAPIDATRDELRDAFENDPEFWFQAALRANDVYDFTPECPVNLMYCTQDEQVPHENSLFLLNEWQARGANVVATDNGPLQHTDCIIPAIYNTKLWLDSLQVTPVIE